MDEALKRAAHKKISGHLWERADNCHYSEVHVGESEYGSLWLSQDMLGEGMNTLCLSIPQLVALREILNHWPGINEESPVAIETEDKQA